jgi:large subunit ribosomal protein L5
MWEFYDRLVSIAIPRIRDFRGINPTGFDGRGNYSMGILEQLIFPELKFDDIKKVNGMNITFVTSANTDAEARSLLKHLGMPFKDSK